MTEFSDTNQCHNASKPMLTDGFLLIPMLEFVLDSDLKYCREPLNVHNKSLFLYDVINYAKLLNQPLKPQMFYPCDDNGVFLEEPTYSEPTSENAIGDLDELVYEYNLAKEKVLFKNTSWSFDDGVYWLILGETYTAFYNFNDKFGDKVLEDFAFRKNLILKDNFFKRAIS
jgi:hypothetical protein